MNDLVATRERRLTRSEFRRLEDLPSAVECFAKIKNPNTRRPTATTFCDVIRAQILTWRKDLEVRTLSPASIRRRLAAAVSRLYKYLCEPNAVLDNPVDGVNRPNEGQ